MIKLSITKLEEVRRNVNLYAQNLKSGVSKSFQGNGRPKSMRWMDAVKVYHLTNDKSKAFSKLEDGFSRRKNTKKNRKEVEDLLESLDNYIFEHINYKYIFIDKQISIDKDFSEFLKLSGWIWILNMKPTGGYAGFLVSKIQNEINWEGDLRFPLIQHYIANNIYGCNSNEVEVGLIDYTTGNHFITDYSDDELQEAIQELNLIGSTVDRILKR